jgi:hypothetical protein
MWQPGNRTWWNKTKEKRHSCSAVLTCCRSFTIVQFQWTLCGGDYRKHVNCNWQHLFGTGNEVKFEFWDFTEEIPLPVEREFTICVFMFHRMSFAVTYICVDTAYLLLIHNLNSVQNTSSIRIGPLSKSIPSISLTLINVKQSQRLLLNYFLSTSSHILYIYKCSKWKLYYWLASWAGALRRLGKSRSRSPGTQDMSLEGNKDHFR